MLLFRNTAWKCPNIMRLFVYLKVRYISDVFKPQDPQTRQSLLSNEATKFLRIQADPDPKLPSNWILPRLSCPPHIWWWACSRIQTGFWDAGLSPGTWTGRSPWCPACRVGTVEEKSWRSTHYSWLFYLEMDSQVYPCRIRNLSSNNSIKCAKNI